MAQPLVRYGLDWSQHAARWDPADVDLKIEMTMVRHGGHQGNLFHHYREIQRILWPDEDHHRWSDLILSEILNNTITCILGPKDCVVGDTEILNPITGESPSIESLYLSGTAPVVMTLNGPAVASVPFLKGEADVFEVICANGSRVTGTAGHLVLSEHGYVRVGQLALGQSLFSFAPNHQESTSDNGPSTRWRGASRWSQTPQGSQSCYPYDCRFYGGPLRLEGAVAQGAAPSRSGVPKRGFHISRQDTPAYRAARIHPLPGQRLHSILDSWGQSNLCRVLQSRPQSEAPELTGAGGVTVSQSCKREHFCAPIPRSPLGHPAKFVSLEQYNVLKTGVVSIRKLGKRLFYDLTVPSAGHYFAQGLIHHNSGKTHGASKYGLCDYYCFPDETLIIVSSTDLRGLEMRVWGDLKAMHDKALERFPFLPGHVIESKHAVCTDGIEEGEIRDMRKGILCVPCLSNGGQFVGLAKYVGMKQKRRRLLADECSFMRDGFLQAISNMNSGDFKGVLMGNTLGQQDPLDQASEPVDGWASMPEPTKTTTWRNKWANGRTLNLVGTDSPNFDYPATAPIRYPYLINRNSIDAVTSFYGTDSLTYYSQCLGVRRAGLNARRVITRELCDQFHAFDMPEWEGSPLTKVAACDAAYGGAGGDRCVGGHAEFGEDMHGKTILLIHPPQLVPVSIKRNERPEDQIAAWNRDYCIDNGIPPENFGYDSTGRGALGLSFARLWSDKVEPVEFGGPATKRIVSSDLYIKDPDTGDRRPKLCYEEFSKFVTELWFMVRYAIEASQIRGMTQELVREGCMREWKLTRGNKKEIETKEDTKKRMGRSPDLFDWLVTTLEMARRRGFTISKIAKVTVSDDDDYLSKEARFYRETLKSKHLSHVRAE